MPLSAGAVALVTVLALAVGVPLLLSCRFIQLLLKPPPPAAEVRTPLLSAAVTDAAGAGSTAVYPARWWALLVFVVMSTVQNNMWISFNVVVDPACEFLRVDTSDINFLATLGPRADTCGVRERPPLSQPGAAGGGHHRLCTGGGRCCYAHPGDIRAKRAIRVGCSGAYSQCRSGPGY
jgi:hypothetical protein